MTLPIERARSRRPITWLTLIGVLLLPAMIGGILVAALHNPTDRLEEMTAAVVNLDKPVTIDGQYTPLGRQLAAGLVEGSDELDSNLTWVISNEDDAAEGMADGRYQAVVTIPKSFSKDATSAGVALQEGEGSAEQAEISVTTPPDGRVADGLISQQIASVAASTLGTMLSEATVGNVLIGFKTIGDQIGDAADGADQLADGARSAADGAAEIPGGATQLADGANKLADGAGELAGGAGQLSSGATQLGTGLDTIAGKAREAANGATTLGQGLTAGATALTDPQGETPSLVSSAAAASDRAQQTAGIVRSSAGEIGALSAQCIAAGASRQFCDELGGAASNLGAAVQPALESQAYTGGVARGVAAVPGQLRAAGDVASQLGAGLGQLAAGVAQSADGARSLSAGADGISTGASGLASGASQLGDGISALGDGAGELSNGLDELASGTGDLAEGLRTASTSLPSFDDEQSTSLASVIADPVTSNSNSNDFFGPATIPLLSAVVLWFGALATFIALRAVPGSALTSRRSSAGMVLRGFWPAAAIGAAQGLVLALVVQLVVEYDAATWWGFAGFAISAGIAFAAINQALVAVLGGIGRWISALVGVLAFATSLISTVPDWLAGLGAAMPTAPALSGLIEPSGAAFAGLVVWAVLSLVAATVAVATRRTASAKAVLAAA
ncbi:YhgE/Pip domain-containing protein [Microbacterium sp. nov. GSS16]|uniref:YhgE/Pip domain-containing protein n=1 Tax=Microbacterium sp. nov. GSS16 TaxID=3019890 RepID=UPI0023069D52|nr:YhgE/Pip domain-containing protein [Microbacterium sp. nov. GSS16]WCD92973.1 YhgE/Pip domain-containing protein [Microbacterium sp. nov. GSS16]